MSIMEIILAGMMLLVGYFIWIIKRYQNKVDEMDNRLTKVETILTVLGDIKDDLAFLRTDVAVIKSRLDNTTPE